jgi:hypothetical protein
VAARRIGEQQTFRASTQRGELFEAQVQDHFAASMGSIVLLSIICRYHAGRSAIRVPTLDESRFLLRNNKIRVVPVG